MTIKNIANVIADNQEAIKGFSKYIDLHNIRIDLLYSVLGYCEHDSDDKLSMIVSLINDTILDESYSTDEYCDRLLNLLQLVIADGTLDNDATLRKLNLMIAGFREIFSSRL